MKERSKREAQDIHARRRAAERFGVAIEPGTLNRIIREIQTGQAKFCWRSSGRVTVFETELAGQPCRVVYDRKRKQIITFMTVKEMERDYPARGTELHRQDDHGGTAAPVAATPDPEVQRAGGAGV